MIPIFDEIVPAGGQATFDLTGISDEYAHLRILISGRTEDAASFQHVRIRFNNDSSAVYNWGFGFAGDAGEGGGSGEAQTFSLVTIVPGGGSNADFVGSAEIVVWDYANAVHFKSFKSNAGLRYATNVESYDLWGTWDDTDAITRVTLFCAAGDFEEGTRCTIYGLRGETLDKRISELAAITDLVGTEEFVVADDGASKKITADDLSAALGGGGGAHFLNAYLEESGSTRNDEFDGGPGVDVKWTLIGTTPNVVDVNSTIPERLYATRTDTGAQWSAYYQSAPSAPFTIAAHVSAFGAGDYQRPFGLWIADASPSTGETNLYWGFNWNGNLILNAIKQTPGGSYAGSDGSIQGYWIGPEVWLRIDVLSGGTTYDAYFSFEGFFWTKFISGGSLGFTAGSCGFAFSPENSGYDVQIALDWFRCSA